MVLGLCAAAAVATMVVRPDRPAPAPQPSSVARAEHARHSLFREIQPVKLANCEMQRFGEQYDGGYLLCANLLGAVKSGYSYGISGYDGWGCDVSRTLGIPVHQYDCFDLTRPACETGNTIFHAECVGAAAVQEGRTFDTLASQIAKNGDRGKNLIVKMDIEGAEWDSFIDAPDEVLQRIDQLAVEFHGSDDPRYTLALLKLKQFFHVVHLHWNNYSCVQDRPPFPTWAYEVLLVNKRIGVPDPSAKAVLPHPLDAPNDPKHADCQAVTVRQ
jgi:hypothetical protein